MKELKIIFVVFCFLHSLFIGYSYSTIISIPDESATIQGGINNAADGDTVLVDEGTYYELIDFSGKNIFVASTYIFDLDSMSILQTIIDGDSSQTQGGGSVVSFKNGEDFSAVLCGFTIKNGIGTYIEEDIYEGFAGGGIYGLNSSPKIINNFIMNNTIDARPIDGSIARGGGIHFMGGAPQIMENLIIHNYAYGILWPYWDGYGGGIYLDNCHTALVKDNTILYNGSGNSGAGIHTQDSWADIRNNNISYNIDGSGGVSCIGDEISGAPVLIDGNTIISNEYFGVDAGEGSNVEITNNLILLNDKGDGVAVFLGSAVIKNNTIAGNGFGYPFLNPSGIYSSGASVDIINNIVVYNRGYGIEFSELGGHTCLDFNNVWGNVEGQYDDYEAGEHDISQNPDFVDPFNEDFTLSIFSPCIDSGDPESAVPEHGGDRIDIGAFEYYQLFNGFLSFEGYPQEVQPGSVATWDVSLMNPTTGPQAIDAWIEFSGPSCGVAKRFINLTIPPGEWNETVEIPIPDYLPEGAYTVKGRIGIFGEEIWDSEVFDLEVLPGPKKFAIPQ